MNPTRLPAQIPAAIAARLRQIGTVVETAETGALYAPLHPREPYANVHVIRDQAYGDDPRHLLDVFTPQRADDTPRPVFIFVHGGGFVAGNKRSDDSPF
ncbi:MAG: alpha/beta hydrolase, partial [Cardiobacterium hominis]